MCTFMATDLSWTSAGCGLLVAPDTMNPLKKAFHCVQ